MMPRLWSSLVLAVCLALAMPVLADTVFSDNFDNENWGAWALNYDDFANWIVTAGAAI